MTTENPITPQHAHGLPRVDDLTHEHKDDRIPRGPVVTDLNFYDPPEDGSKPFNYVETPPEGEPQRNFGAKAYQVEINDLRGRESEFHLDRQAFAALQNYPHNPKINWDDDESVKKDYYPEVEKILLNDLPGTPNRVLIFDHTIRRAGPDAPRAPVTRCHIDQTGKSAQMRVEYHLPDEAEELLKGRYRIVNVWRPINNAVESQPLAFCDSETVPNEDMVPVEHRYPYRTGETAGVKYSSGQKWWYWSGIDNNERILLQCFDSKLPNNRVPHTAFIDPRNDSEAKPRESIEVRALVFG